MSPVENWLAKVARYNCLKGSHAEWLGEENKGRHLMLRHRSSFDTLREIGVVIKQR
jgi:hypothetical protein